MDRWAVGKRIRQLRKARGWDQLALALESHLANASSISKIEKGQVDMPLSTLLAIARALDIAVSTLVCEEAPETVPVSAQVLHDLYTRSQTLANDLAALLPP